MLPSSPKPESEKHTCHICKESFPALGYLKTHLHSHVKRCDLANVREQISIRREREKQSKTVYPCDKCSNVYINPKSCSIHAKSHCGAQVYECSVCRLAYDTLGKLQQHISLLHDVVRKYECLFCHAVFPMKSSVKEHLPVHLKARPAKCNICNEGIRNELKVQKHHYSLYHPGKELDCSISAEYQGLLNELNKYVSSTETYPNVFEKYNTSENRNMFEEIKKMAEVGSENSMEKKRRTGKIDYKRHTNTKKSLDPHEMHETGSETKKTPHLEEFASQTTKTNTTSTRKSKRILAKKGNEEPIDISMNKDSDNEPAVTATKELSDKVEVHSKSYTIPDYKDPLVFDGKFHFCFDCGLRFIYKDILVQHLQSSCKKSLLEGNKNTNTKPSIRTVKLCDKCGQEYTRINKHSCAHQSIEKETDSKMDDGGTLNTAEIDHMKHVWNQVSDKYPKSRMPMKRRPEYRYNFESPPDGELNCDLCDFHCKVKNELVKHMRQRHFHERFKCKTCDKTFKYRYEMRYHERTHTGETPWICPACGAAFAGKSNLNTHLKKFHSDADIQSPHQAVRLWSNPLDGLNATVHLTTDIKSESGDSTITSEQIAGSSTFEQLIRRPIAQQRTIADTSKRTSKRTIAGKRPKKSTGNKKSKLKKTETSPKKPMTQSTPSISTDIILQDKARLDNHDNDISIAPLIQQTEYVVFRSEDNSRIYVYSDEPLEAAKNIGSILMEHFPAATVNKEAGLQIAIQYADGESTEQVMDIGKQCEAIEEDGRPAVQYTNNGNAKQVGGHENQGNEIVEKIAGVVTDNETIQESDGLDIKYTVGDSAVRIVAIGTQGEIIEENIGLENQYTDVDLTGKAVGGETRPESSDVKLDDSSIMAASDEWLDEYMRATTDDHMAGRDVPPTSALVDWPQIDHVDAEGTEVAYTGQVGEPSEGVAGSSDSNYDPAGDDLDSDDSGADNNDPPISEVKGDTSLLVQFSTFATSRQQGRGMSSQPGSDDKHMNPKPPEAATDGHGEQSSSWDTQQDTCDEPPEVCSQYVFLSDQRTIGDKQDTDIDNGLIIKESDSQDNETSSSKFSEIRKGSDKYSEISLEQLKTFEEDATIANLIEELRNTHVNAREKLFVCNICMNAGVVKVTYKINMQTHIYANHGGKLDCHVCNKSFKSHYYLKHHIRTQHGDVKFQCSICRKYFSTANYLRIHEDQHAGRYLCNICQAVLPSNSALALHKRRHSDNPYKCIRCQKSFKSSRLLSNHKHIFHSVKVFRQLYGDSSDSVNKILSAYRKTLPENCSLFHCPLCPYKSRKKSTYNRFDELEDHATRTHSKTDCICVVCGAGYKLQKSLSKHMKSCHGKMHVPMKPVSNDKPCKHVRIDKPCVTLETTEEVNLFLSEYEDTVTNAHEFKCPLCMQTRGKSRVFDRMWKFKKHVREVHTGSNFICEMCGSSYKTSSFLKYHIKMVHVKDFKCQICGKEFHSTYTIRKHSQTHLTKCEHCQIKYKQTKGHNCKVLIECKLIECKRCSLKYKSTQKHRCQNLNHYVDCSNVNLDNYLNDKELDTILMDVKNSPKPAGYDCPVCIKVCGESQTYRTLKSIRSHMKSAHAYRWMMCEICGGMFYGSDKLKIHARIHNDNNHYEQVFECGVCNLEFSDYREFKEHGNIHVEKLDAKTPMEVDKILSSYQESLSPECWSHLECPVCLKKDGQVVVKFPNFLSLRCHLENVHMSKKFACKICNVTFETSYDVKRHVWMEHIKKYSCSCCGEQYPNEEQFDQHKEVKGILCPNEICRIQLESQCCLTTHINTHHSRPATSERIKVENENDEVVENEGSDNIETPAGNARRKGQKMESLCNKDIENKCDEKKEAENSTDTSSESQEAAASIMSDIKTRPKQSGLWNFFISS